MKKSYTRRRTTVSFLRLTAMAIIIKQGVAGSERLFTPRRNIYLRYESQKLIPNCKLSA